MISLNKSRRNRQYGYYIDDAMLTLPRTSLRQAATLPLWYDPQPSPDWISAPCMFRWKRHKPVLSIVVVCYDMPHQALNTLYSLSRDYQRRVDAVDYEVLLVENRSANNLGKSALKPLGDQFRYYARRERRPTPVNAINFGLGKARGRYIAVMIDGARLVSPGIIHRTLQAFRISEDAVVGTPGYHLGTTIQQESSLAGYDEAYERRLLSSINWREQGYRLFEIACLSQSCARGALAPLPESNWLAMSRRNFDLLGGYHTGFGSHGGGYANHDAWRRACELPHTQPVVLAGEGCFHQHHGGATTDARDKNLGRVLDEISQQYRDIRGCDFQAPAAPALILGSIPAPALGGLAATVDGGPGTSG
jgi:hypothetical protein